METKEKSKNYGWILIEVTAMGALMPLFVNLLLGGAYGFAVAVLYTAMTLLLGVMLYKTRELKEDVYLAMFKLVVEFKVMLFVTSIMAFTGGSMVIGVSALVGAIALGVIAGLLAIRNVLNSQ